ncbi:hypothetical protein [Hymenobacter volaticus]|uniref:Uncharacterized protein n=1 Tax=Hymenobacter volaticus TaxID=2932254 RepID=A0ABY4GCX6_9BACT|nr:hypothetical protein [Hymenobacter volaticus]UOQ68773.1 hypothetical protein MUN86_25145 [Hymenobacter volaticus]
MDGTPMKAVAFSPYDVVGLATATGAANMHFYLAIEESSTRHRGDPLSSDIVIELAGEDPAGQPLRTRHAVVHPQEQMPLTGLGAALILAYSEVADYKGTVP